MSETRCNSSELGSGTIFNYGRPGPAAGIAGPALAGGIAFSSFTGESLKLVYVREIHTIVDFDSCVDWL